MTKTIDLSTAKTITIHRRGLPDFIAWDGCHKLYTLATQKDIDEAKGYGYDIIITAQLPSLWAVACGLRFIQMFGGTFEDIVPQGRECEKLTFTGFGRGNNLIFEGLDA